MISLVLVNLIMLRGMRTVSQSLWRDDLGSMMSPVITASQSFASSKVVHKKKTHSLHIYCLFIVLLLCYIKWTIYLGLNLFIKLQLSRQLVQVQAPTPCFWFILNKCCNIFCRFLEPLYTFTYPFLSFCLSVRHHLAIFSISPRSFVVKKWTWMDWNVHHFTTFASRPAQCWLAEALKSYYIYSACTTRSTCCNGKDNFKLI